MRNVTLGLTQRPEGILDVNRVFILHTFEFAAELRVTHDEADEDREEDQAGEENDRVVPVVPLEVHEDQGNDGGFDRGDEKSNDEVARMAKIDVAGAHSDDRESEQRAPCGDVHAEGQDVRMMFAVGASVFVLCVRGAHDA